MKKFKTVADTILGIACASLLIQLALWGIAAIAWLWWTRAFG